MNNVLVVDRWFDQAAGEPVYGTRSELVAGTKVPLRVEFFSKSDAASIELSATLEGKPEWTNRVVPPDWLSPLDQGALPTGWSLSVAGLSYAGMVVSNDSATLLSPTGETTEYRREGTGFAPPDGDNGVLAADSNTGNLTLQAVDGLTYTFGGDGRLLAAVSSVDDLLPAAPRYFYGSAPEGGVRLKSIEDPVTHRKLRLSYGGEACPDAPPGFDAIPPTGMLCAVASDWDGTMTKFFYVSGQLARVEDAGGEVTDYGYSSGRISRIRSPLAADAIASGVRADEESAQTTVTYVGQKVSSVELPAPMIGDPRPRRTYLYAAAHTDVDVIGTSSQNGHDRRVVFDEFARTVEETGSDGLTASLEWGQTNRLLSNTDSAGRKTTTLYDEHDRATDSYGPAPASWFGEDNRPTAEHVGDVPHEALTYEDPSSLAAAYWANDGLTGAPNCRGTGANRSDGVIVSDWGTGSPDCLMPQSDGWSARYSGRIRLPESGPYAFKIDVAGSTRLWIDDELILDAWAQRDGTVVSEDVSNLTANSVRRIRLEYANSLGPARLGLHWRRPSQTVDEPVDGAYLSASYDLPSSVSQDDGASQHVSTTAYGLLPHEALPTSTTTGSPDSPIEMKFEYEATGSGKYRRQIRKTLPAGNSWSYAYYGDTEKLSSPPCGLAQTAIQGGSLRSKSRPDPDGSGPKAALVEEYAYNSAGLRIASRVGLGEWTCSEFDSRDRLTSRSFAPVAGEPGRSVTYDYAVGGNPLVRRVVDPVGAITQVVDLLDRVISYTDVWGKTTVTSYDQAGRVQRTDSPAGVTDLAYSPVTARPASQILDGRVVAEPLYDSNTGELSAVGYPGGTTGAGNGTSLSIGTDAAGRTNSITWSKGNTVIASESVRLSQVGRVVDQSIDGVDAHPGDNFEYDEMGRLRRARVPGRDVAYFFDASAGCGSLATAGRNSNRTSMTVNGETPISYCYDDADRLTAVSDSRYPSIEYDDRGNTTTLGSERIAYDAANRHVRTVKGSTTVEYERDATDRIVSRSTTTRHRVQFQSATSGHNGQGGELVTVQKPTNADPGELMLMHVSIGAGKAALTVTPPQGWTPVVDTDNSEALRSLILRKFVGSSEPDSYSVRFSRSVTSAIGIGLYAGVDSVTPLEDSRTATATLASSVTVGSISASDQGAVVGYFALGNSQVNSPAEMAERWETSTTAGLGLVRVTSVSADEPRTNSGPTGTRKASLVSGSSNWVGTLIALRPRVDETYTRFGFSSGADASTFTMDGASNLLERTIQVVGGALITRQQSEGDVWSYPNLRGDVVAVADGAGSKIGQSTVYDAYGEQVSGPSPSSTFGFGWKGADRRRTESAAEIATIEMGARPYVPGLGRFLAADPVEAGSCNDFDYACADPMNNADITGLACEGRPSYVKDSVFYRTRPYANNSLHKVNLFCGDKSYGVKHIQRRGHFGGMVTNRVRNSIRSTLHSPDSIRHEYKWRSKTWYWVYESNWVVQQCNSRGHCTPTDWTFEVRVVIHDKLESIVTAYVPSATDSRGGYTDRCAHCWADGGRWS